MASRWAKAWAGVRQHGPDIGLEILVNGALPLVIYQLVDKQVGDVRALIASSVPPILWSLFQFIKSRRIDALSLLIITGIALSILALLGGGGARFLQLRENLVTGVIGVVLLVSAAIGKPLMYYLAVASMRRNAPDGAAELQGLRGNAFFERTMTLMTLVWGLGLIARTAIAVVLVFSVSIPTYLALNAVVGYASTFLLIGWTVWYGQRQRRRGMARRAAAQAAAAASGAPP